MNATVNAILVTPVADTDIDLIKLHLQARRAELSLSIGRLRDAGQNGFAENFEQQTEEITALLARLP